MRTEKVLGRSKGTSNIIMGEALAPLMEGPAAAEEYRDEDGAKINNNNSNNNEFIISAWLNMKSWMLKKRWSSAADDPYFLLAVLGCPLAPVPASSDPLPHLSIKDVSIEVSSAQYIVHQYVAATGATRLHTSVHSSYIAGRLKMVKSKSEPAAKAVKLAPKLPAKSAENGCFVLWQMMPDNKWYMELALEGYNSMIQAGSNGKLVWWSTPWRGAHAAKGPVRPLRRILQGLNPMVTANIFANSRCVGEKRIGNDDCFVLKVAVDQTTLTERSDSPAEIIRHIILGCFSQRTGYLMYLEDSHLVRVQDAGSNATYWEVTTESTLKDYRNVDGVVVAHGGKSITTLYRFGEEVKGHTKTRMQEKWSIEEVAFNVEGLSQDFFRPPSDLMAASTVASYHLPFMSSRRMSRKKKKKKEEQEEAMAKSELSDECR